MKYILVSFILIVFIFSCSKTDKGIELTEEEKIESLKFGNEISNKAQKILLKNVASAIETGGTEYAIEFCNTKAISLTDSISKTNQIRIQRLSDKNRNPNNAIKTDVDKIAWQRINQNEKEFLLKGNNNEVYYYKPIILGVPACVKCHGSSVDIERNTQKNIKDKYPNDLAVNYKLGDLRGMWKIKIK
ncbi:Tll0287-like domain-containing protein [Empedobacter tilapiae]